MILVKKEWWKCTSIDNTNAPIIVNLSGYPTFACCHPLPQLAHHIHISLSKKKKKLSPSTGSDVPPPPFPNLPRKVEGGGSIISPLWKPLVLPKRSVALSPGAAIKDELFNLLKPSNERPVQIAFHELHNVPQSFITQKTQMPN